MTFEVEDDFEGTDAFLAQLDPAAAEDNAKRSTVGGEEDQSQSTAEAPEGEAGTEPEEAPEGAPESDGQPSDDEDEKEFSYKDGETESKVKLRDLKAAYAERQVAAQRAAEAAQARETAAAGHQRADAALKELLARAEKAFEPYKNLNLLALSRDPTVDNATFQQIQSDAQAAHANLQYLQTELQANLQAAQQNAQAAQREAAVACLKALQDPKTGIEGFGPQTWKDISSFAVQKGLPQATVESLTDPAAIKLIHMAMQFEQQKAAAAKAAAKVKVVTPQPSRTMKATSTASNSDNATPGKRDALRALRASGSIDDAVDAFVASF